MGDRNDSFPPLLHGGTKVHILLNVRNSFSPGGDGGLDFVTLLEVAIKAMCVLSVLGEALASSGGL